MSRPTWPTTRYRSNTATNTARRSRADRPHRPVVAHGPTAPRRPLVHTVRCIPPGGMSGAYHLTARAGRWYIPPDLPTRPSMHSVRQSPPARRCMPHAPAGPSVHSARLPHPARRCIPPDCRAVSTEHTARLLTPVRRCTPPDCRACRCISPDGPSWHTARLPPAGPSVHTARRALPARCCISPDFRRFPSPIWCMARRLHRPVPNMLHAIPSSSSGIDLLTDSRIVRLPRIAPVPGPVSRG